MQADLCLCIDEISHTHTHTHTTHMLTNVQTYADSFSPLRNAYARINPFPYITRVHTRTCSKPFPDVHMGTWQTILLPIYTCAHTHT